jgi:hypothetical protein
MKTIYKMLSLVGLLLLILCFIPTISAHSVKDHDIKITTIDDTLSVEEQIILKQQNNSHIDFFVPSDATDLSVIINNTDIEATAISDTIYQINYSKGIDKNQITIILKYSQSEPSLFNKEIIYDTTSLMLTYDGKTVSNLNSLNSGSSISINIPTEQDTKTSLNLYTTILIALLVVLVIVTSAYGIKKRGNGLKRNRDVESSEMLTTEKALLMNVLKEIEKKHRDKKISDETYQKLKTHYKQQTVDIMSSLEE